MLEAVYEDTVDWQPTSIMIKGARMIGCIAGRLGDAMELMRAGKIETQALVTHEYPLDDITEAFAMQANTHEAIKVMVKP
jgi:threonine dehydrogenase-like Zn-dependent dehydrogenase